MNIKELRIGNLVMLPKYWKEIPIEVTGISIIDRRDDQTGIYEEYVYLKGHDFTKDATFEQFVDYKQGVTTTEDIEPIQLTKEWIEKLGGYYANEGCASDYYFKLNEDDVLLISEKWNRCAVIINDVNNDDKRGSVGLSVINYVHEIQNLFYALTGKELELKP